MPKPRKTHSAATVALIALIATAPATRAAETLPTPAPLMAPSPAPAEPSPEVIRRDPALGVAFSVLPGYGLGHFLIGDQAGGIKFLALDLATTFVWALGPSIVSVAEGETPDKPTRNGFWSSWVGSWPGERSRSGKQRMPTTLRTGRTDWRHWSL